MRALEAIGNVVREVFAQCQCGDCTKFTLGVVCGRCSRRVCLAHGYVTLGAPPQSVCALCVLVEHPELLRQARVSKGAVVVPMPREAP